MLACLRDYAFVRGDYKHYNIDPARSGKHIFDETLVTRNVDETKMHFADAQLGKPEINGYSAPFFLWQTIRVDARQRLYQSSFAVVDMSGGADDNIH
jgi:hypothetical protein